VKSTPKTNNNFDIKPPFSGITSENVRPTVNTVKKMRPISRGGSNLQG